MQLKTWLFCFKSMAKSKLNEEYENQCNKHLSHPISIHREVVWKNKKQGASDSFKQLQSV